MKCPHCHKAIKREHSDELKAEAIKLSKQGFSTRDIESILQRRVSFGTVAYWLRAERMRG